MSFIIKNLKLVKKSLNIEWSIIQHFYKNFYEKNGYKNSILGYKNLILGYKNSILGYKNHKIGNIFTTLWYRNMIL